MYGYGPLFPVGSRIDTAIYSYNGTLHFGVIGDHATMPDVDVLAQGIVAGLDELLTLAAPPTDARASRKGAGQ
jgi:hypothetical protein